MKDSCGTLVACEISRWPSLRDRAVARAPLLEDEVCRRVAQTANVSNMYGGMSRVFSLFPGPSSLQPASPPLRRTAGLGCQPGIFTEIDSEASPASLLTCKGTCRNSESLAEQVLGHVDHLVALLFASDAEAHSKACGSLSSCNGGLARKGKMIEECRWCSGCQKQCAFCADWKQATVVVRACAPAFGRGGGSDKANDCFRT